MQYLPKSASICTFDVAVSQIVVPIDELANVRSAYVAASCERVVNEAVEADITAFWLVYCSIAAIVNLVVERTFFTPLDTGEASYVVLAHTIPISASGAVSCLVARTTERCFTGFADQPFRGCA